MLKTLKRSPVWMFLSLTLIFSAIVLVMLLFSGDETVFIRNILVGFYFACPGLAAIAASIINFHSLKNLGWGSSKSKRLLLVYFLPLLYGALIYAPVWLISMNLRYSIEIQNRMLR